MRRARLVAVAVVLVAGAVAWWWPQSMGTPPAAPTSVGAVPAPVEDTQPEPEELNLRAFERIEETLRVEAGRETAGSTGPELIAVKCRVLDEDGNPIPKARVLVRRVERGSGHLLIAADQELVTHFDGTFRCAVPRGQEREITVLGTEEYSGSLPSMLGSHSGGTAFVVAREPNLTGVVLDEHGAPMAEARIQVAGTKRLLEANVLERRKLEIIELTTDAQGAFSGRIPPRKEPVFLRVHPNEERAGELLYEERTDVALGSAPTRVRFAKPIYIEGHVVDLADNGVGNAFIDARWDGRGLRPSGLSPYTASNYGTGAFRIGPLRAGTYALMASYVGRLELPEEVTVEAPAENVRIVCRTWGIWGTVVNYKDLKLRYGFVSCLPVEPSKNGHGWRGAELDDAGKFWLGYPLKGTHRLYFHGGGDEGWCAEVRNVRPGIGLEVRLQKGLSISGTYGDREPGKKYWVEAHRSGFTRAATLDEDGAFKIEGCTAGTWTVQVSHKDDDGEFVTVAEKQVEAGATDVALGG